MPQYELRISFPAPTARAAKLLQKIVLERIKDLLPGFKVSTELLIPVYDVDDPGGDKPATARTSWTVVEVREL